MKIKKIISNVLYFCLIAIVAFTAIKVAVVLIMTPILMFYGTATDFYQLVGDASYFDLAAKATKMWLSSLLTLSLGALLIKIVRMKRREKNE